MAVRLHHCHLLSVHGMCQVVFMTGMIAPGRLILAASD